MSSTPSRRFFCLMLFTSLGTQLSWADDWPVWRGPNRSGISAESSGFDRGAWPPKKTLWKANVGEGCSSPVVVGNQLYTIGWTKNADVLRCLDATSGKERWRVTYAAPKYGRHSTGDKSIYSGICSTPEFDSETGYLYTLGIDGHLNCWDTKKRGKLVWKLNLYDRYSAPRRPRVKRSGLRDYGYTSSPLVQGQALIVEVGSPKHGTLIAFDKRNGKQLWSSQAKFLAGHNAGPTPITVEGVPCVAVHHFDGLLVTRIDAGHEGETVATAPWRTEFANNIAQVSVQGNSCLLTSAYDHVLIARFDISLGGVKKVWEQRYASKVCTPVIHKGSVYWAWRRLYCLDFATGALRWQGGRYGDPGSCIATSDDRLIVFSNRGNLTLVESALRSPKKYSQLATVPQLFRTDAWPHIVLANGRLYCKDRAGNLICLALQ